MRIRWFNPHASWWYWLYLVLSYEYSGFVRYATSASGYSLDHMDGNHEKKTCFSCLLRSWKSWAGWVVIQIPYTPLSKMAALWNFAIDGTLVVVLKLLQMTSLLWCSFKDIKHHVALMFIPYPRARTGIADMKLSLSSGRLQKEYEGMMSGMIILPL
jgi:hypothetical protein